MFGLLTYFMLICNQYYSEHVLVQFTSLWSFSAELAISIVSSDSLILLMFSFYYYASFSDRTPSSWFTIDIEKLEDIKHSSLSSTDLYVCVLFLVYFCLCSFIQVKICYYFYPSIIYVFCLRNFYFVITLSKPFSANVYLVHFLT